MSNDSIYYTPDETYPDILKSRRITGGTCSIKKAVRLINATDVAMDKSLVKLKVTPILSKESGLIDFLEGHEIRHTISEIKNQIAVGYIDKITFSRVESFGEIQSHLVGKDNQDYILSSVIHDPIRKTAVFSYVRSTTS